MTKNPSTCEVGELGTATPGFNFTHYPETGSRVTKPVEGGGRHSNPQPETASLPHRLLTQREARPHPWLISPVAFV